MAKAIFEVQTRLPSLNEYIDTCRRNRFQAAKMKRDIQANISPSMRHLPTFKRPVILAFEWHERNRRRDCDNVAFAKKFILDALVGMGKLKNDSPAFVTGFRDSFVYDGKDLIVVQIEEVKK